MILWYRVGKTHLLTFDLFFFLFFGRGDPSHLVVEAPINPVGTLSRKEPILPLISYFPAALVLVPHELL